MDKIILMVLHILFFSTACENEDDQKTIYQTKIIAQEACKEVEMEGLKVSLCVLDTTGIPKSSFNQNENFIAALSFQNETDKNIKIKEEYLANEGVLTVMGDNNDESFGKPFTSVSCQFDGSLYMEIPPGETYTISSPWVLQEGIGVNGPICKTESNENLAVGSYRVVVSLDFVMVMGVESVRIEEGNQLILEFDII